MGIDIIRGRMYVTCMASSEHPDELSLLYRLPTGHTRASVRALMQDIGPLVDQLVQGAEAVLDEHFRFCIRLPAEERIVDQKIRRIISCSVEARPDHISRLKEGKE